MGYALKGSRENFQNYRKIPIIMVIFTVSGDNWIMIMITVCMGIVPIIT